MPTGHFCCPVSTSHSRHLSPTAFSQSLFPTLSGVPFLLPVASRSRTQAFVWFRAKTDKGIVCLADPYIVLHLQKLYDNISKSNRLNTFEEIAICFSDGFQMTSQSPKSLFSSSFLSIGKCWRYSYIQFIFALTQSLVNLSLKHATHNN